MNKFFENDDLNVEFRDMKGELIIYFEEEFQKLQAKKNQKLQSEERHVETAKLIL